MSDVLAGAGPKPEFRNAYTVEEAAAVVREQIAWQRRRDALAETHRKRQRISDPVAAQERHSPTVEIAVDDPASKRRIRRNITRVRQSEAWRHNQLDPMQRQAETEIAAAWLARTVGLQAHSLRLDRVGSGSPPAGNERWALELDHVWREWVNEARRRRISVKAMLMLVTEPMTLPDVERACRLRPGRAIEVYCDGLDLWAKLRGWTASTDCGQLAIYG
jgi:hypothetical protein